MNDSPDSDTAARLAGGYLLWTACGAGFRFSRSVQVPWLITSAVSDKQLGSFYSACSVFRSARNAEHAKSREAYERVKNEKKHRAKNLPAGFDDSDNDEEQRLKEESEMTCHPVLGDIDPPYARLLQVMEFSRYKSTGVIDRGPGRAAMLLAANPVAMRHFNKDPVLRILRTGYCETHVRSSDGGAVSYSAFGGESFYALTVIPDVTKVANNIDAMSGITGGLAVVMPGRPRTLIPESTFATLLDRVHCFGRQPHPVDFEGAGWDKWFSDIPELGLSEYSNKKIEQLQDICSWDSLRGLVLGTIASELMSAAPGALTLGTAALADATALLESAARIVYKTENTEHVIATRAANSELARKTLAQNRANERERKLPGWSAALREELKANGGTVSARNLTRGGRVLTESQLEAVLSAFPNDFDEREGGVCLLRDAAPPDPVVMKVFDELAATIRSRYEEGEKPWLPMDQIGPAEVVWKELVEYGGGNVLCCREGQTKVAVVLRDRHGWLAQWKFFPNVVKKANESNVKYQDNEHTIPSD